MANIKLTVTNYDSKLEDWKNNTGTTRDDILYFVKTEMNISDIRQVAWDKGLIIQIDGVDDFSSKITFVDLLTQ
jgi:hypothetical protein